MNYFFNVNFCSFVLACAEFECAVPLHKLHSGIFSPFSFFLFVFFFFEEVLNIIERLLIEIHLLVYNCTPAFSPNAASVYFSLQGSYSDFSLC